MAVPREEPLSDDYEEGEIVEDDDEAASSWEEGSSEEDYPPGVEPTRRRKQHLCKETSLCRTERPPKACYARLVRKPPQPTSLPLPPPPPVLTEIQTTAALGVTSFEKSSYKKNCYANKDIDSSIKLQPRGLGDRGRYEKDNKCKSKYSCSNRVRESSPHSFKREKGKSLYNKYTSPLRSYPRRYSIRPNRKSYRGSPLLKTKRSEERKRNGYTVEKAEVQMDVGEIDSKYLVGKEEEEEEEDDWELRMQALKTAILKKHSQRQKRGLKVRRTAHNNDSLVDILNKSDQENDWEQDGTLNDNQEIQQIQSRDSFNPQYECSSEGYTVMEPHLSEGYSVMEPHSSVIPVHSYYSSHSYPAPIYSQVALNPGYYGQMGGSSYVPDSYNCERYNFPLVQYQTSFGFNGMGQGYTSTQSYDQGNVRSYMETSGIHESGESNILEEESKPEPPKSITPLKFTLIPKQQPLCLKGNVLDNYNKRKTKWGPPTDDSKTSEDGITQELDLSEIKLPDHPPLPPPPLPPPLPSNESDMDIVCTEESSSDIEVITDEEDDYEDIEDDDNLEEVRLRELALKSLCSKNTFNSRTKKVELENKADIDKKPKSKPKLQTSLVVKSVCSNEPNVASVCQDDEEIMENDFDLDGTPLPKQIENDSSKEMIETNNTSNKELDSDCVGNYENKNTPKDDIKSRAGSFDGDNWEDVDEDILRAQLLSSLSNKMKNDEKKELSEKQNVCKEPQIFVKNSVKPHKFSKFTVHSMSRKRKNNSLNENSFIGDGLVDSRLQLQKRFIISISDDSDSSLEASDEENIQQECRKSSNTTNGSKDIEMSVDKLLLEARAQVENKKVVVANVAPNQTSVSTAPSPSSNTSSLKVPSSDKNQTHSDLEKKVGEIKQKSSSSKSSAQVKQAGAVKTPVQFLPVSQQKEYHRLKLKITEKKILLLKKLLNSKVQKKNTSSGTLTPTSTSSIKTSSCNDETEAKIVFDTHQSEDLSRSNTHDIEADEISVNMTKEKEKLKCSEMSLLEAKVVISHKLYKMSDLVENIEKEKTELISLEQEVFRLRQELLALENHLVEQANKIMFKRRELGHCEQVISQEIETCRMLEKQCATLGVIVNGPNYKPPGEEAEMARQRVYEVLTRAEELCSNMRWCPTLASKSGPKSPLTVVNPKAKEVVLFKSKKDLCNRRTPVLLPKRSATQSPKGVKKPENWKTVKLLLAKKGSTEIKRSIFENGKDKKGLVKLKSESFKNRASILAHKQPGLQGLRSAKKTKIGQEPKETSNLLAKKICPKFTSSKEVHMSLENLPVLETAKESKDKAPEVVSNNGTSVLSRQANNNSEKLGVAIIETAKDAKEKTPEVVSNNGTILLSKQANNKPEKLVEEASKPVFAEQTSQKALVRKNNDTTNKNLVADIQNKSVLQKITKNELETSDEPAENKVVDELSSEATVEPVVQSRCLESRTGKWDPNWTICPFDLDGVCRDSDCKFQHFKTSYPMESSLAEAASQAPLASLKPATSKLTGPEDKGMTIS